MCSTLFGTASLVPSQRTFCTGLDERPGTVRQCHCPADLHTSKLRQPTASEVLADRASTWRKSGKWPRRSPLKTLGSPRPGLCIMGRCQLGQPFRTSSVQLHAPAKAGESPAVIEGQPPTGMRAGHSGRGLKKRRTSRNEVRHTIVVQDRADSVLEQNIAYQ